MGGATRTFFFEVFDEAIRLLQQARADHLVIGSVAVRALQGEQLDPSEDIDILIRADDAERLLEVFRAAGYATHRRDEGWIYKAARPDVTIDLIFRAGESIELDDEHLARARRVTVEDLTLPVPCFEDEAVMKAIFDAPDRRGGWYEAVELLRGTHIDWDYVVRRGDRHGPRRIAALLLYASDEGIELPSRIVSSAQVIASSA